MGANGDPGKVAMGKSDAKRKLPILVRQINFKQDHRAIKRDQAHAQLQIIQCRQPGAYRHRADTYDPKGKFAIGGIDAMSFANQFSALGRVVRPVRWVICRTGKFHHLVSTRQNPFLGRNQKRI